MQIDKYHVFYEVVTLGISCGLNTPQEWIRNYEQHYTNILAYHDIPNVEKIMWDFVVPSLYHSVNLEQQQDVATLAKWVCNE